MVVAKFPGGGDRFFFEAPRPPEVPGYTVDVGPRKSALGSLPEDESRFPVATWLKRALVAGIQPLALAPREMRAPSAGRKAAGFYADGSNLPWVVHSLSAQQPHRFADWLSHVRTASPDIDDVRTVDRPEDRKRYLLVRHTSGLGIPSWLLSDGTLRLLALTILPYLADTRRIWLVEEPENSLHPLSIETVVQSLQSVYDGQVLVATHSPLVLSLVEPKDVLVFARDEAGGTRITTGNEHPGLRDWHGEVSLGTLFAGGVLG